MEFLRDVKAHDTGNARNLERFKDLNRWRNAIAHQGFARVNPPLRVNEVQTWRQTCDDLVTSFDAVVGNHLRSLVPNASW